MVDRLRTLGFCIATLIVEVCFSGSASGQFFSDNFEEQNRRTRPPQGWVEVRGPASPSSTRLDWSISSIGGLPGNRIFGQGQLRDCARRCPPCGGKGGTRDILYAGDPLIDFPQTFDLEFDFRFHSPLLLGGEGRNRIGRHGGVVFCVPEANPYGDRFFGYHLYWLDGEGGLGPRSLRGLSLIRWDPGDWRLNNYTLLGNYSSIQQPPDHWRIAVYPTAIQIWGDGELLITTADETYRGGRLGLKGWGTQTVTYDNFRATRLDICESGNLCEDCDPVDIRPGQSLTGDLGTSVCRDDDEGLVAIFALQVDADFSGTLSVTSDNFNPSLSFYNDLCDEVARNNVCRIAEADACLRVDLEPGTYTLSVRSQDPEVTGNFSISVSEMEEVEIFSRGDANADSQVDLSDAVFLLNFLFLGAGNPLCPDAADINDDGGLNLSDAVYLLNRLFLGGLEIAIPGRFECGADPTGDDLDCGRFPPCDL